MVTSHHLFFSHSPSKTQRISEVEMDGLVRANHGECCYFIVDSLNNNSKPEVNREVLLMVICAISEKICGPLK